MEAVKVKNRGCSAFSTRSNLTIAAALHPVIIISSVFITMYLPMDGHIEASGVEVLLLLLLPHLFKTRLATLVCHQGVSNMNHLGKKENLPYQYLSH